VVERFLKRSTIDLILHHRISEVTHSMCMYPHQGIASFRPTSKDSFCGAHGRRFRSMHLFHIYCKIKDWIHGDGTSYKLIKIVQVYRKRILKIKDSFYESLSSSFGGHGT
jgi:hypothetical protein